jgi:hypothetical protein
MIKKRRISAETAWMSFAEQDGNFATGPVKQKERPLPYQRGKNDGNENL